MKPRSSSVATSRQRTSRVASRRQTLPAATRVGSLKTRQSASRKSAQNRKSAQATTDHEKIRKWVEERGGHPAIVARTVKGKELSGVIRIDFPGFSGARSLKPISWDEWFNIFEERRLGLLHQDRTASGKPSRFNKLVCRS